jgi:HSP20 family protein
MFGKWKYTDFAAMMEEKARRHARGHYRRPKYNVPVNIIEHETEFELHVFATTYPKENIKVSVVNDMLYVTGTREPKDLSPNFMLQEYPIKSFERSFELSHRADKSKIKAHYKDGVLIVKVGKAQAAMDPEMEIDVE